MKTTCWKERQMPVFVVPRQLMLAGLALTLMAQFLSVPLADARTAAQPRQPQSDGVSVLTTLPVILGTAETYGVLAGQGVTNTGLTVVNGDLGTWPNPAVTGFAGPPGGTVNGTIHAGDAVAQLAQFDLTTAYDDAAGRPFDATISSDLGGQTLAAGVYVGTTLAISGQLPLTLDGGGDFNAVFIFQSASTLITGPGSTIELINEAQACNVFWQVGSSATIDTTSEFSGTILALTSISVENGAIIDGRLLARNGAVTLINDTITVPVCEQLDTPTPNPTFVPTATVTSTPTPLQTLTTPTLTATPVFTPAETVTPTPILTPTPTPVFTPAETVTPTPILTPTPTPVFSPAETVTPTPALTLTPTPLFSPAETVTPTPPLTLTPTPGFSPAQTITPTPAPTPQLTNTPFPAMEITKEFVGDPPQRPGDAVNYIIRITNTGQTVITEIPLDDHYPPEYLEFVSCDPPFDFHFPESGLIQWLDLTVVRGDLQPGASIEVYVNFILKAFPPYGADLINIAATGELQAQVLTPMNPYCSWVYMIDGEFTIEPKGGLLPGQHILILSVPVHNTGPFDISLVDVYFAFELTPFDLSDDPNPSLIGVDVIGPIPAGGAVTASVEWDVSAFPEIIVPVYVAAIQRDYPECSDLIQTDVTVPVRLAAFDALPGDNSARLEWVTETEICNLGFQLWRSGEYDGVYTQVGPALIPGAGTSFARHTYAYTDEPLSNGSVYFYKLASVDCRGREELARPVPVVPQPQPPQTRIITASDRVSYTAGQPWILLGKVSNPGAAEQFRFTMVAVIDGSAQLTLIPEQLVSIPAGIAMEGEVFRHAWTLQQPTGRYVIYSALLDPTSSAVRYIHVSEFSYLGSNSAQGNCEKEQFRNAATASRTTGRTQPPARRAFISIPAEAMLKINQTVSK